MADKKYKEDKKHFLFDCNHYVHERDKMFQDIGVNFGNFNIEDKFKAILSIRLSLADI